MKASLGRSGCRYSQLDGASQLSMLLLASLGGWAPSIAPASRNYFINNLRSSADSRICAPVCDDAVTLRNELVELLGEVENRGKEASEELQNDILEVVSEMDGDGDDRLDWKKKDVEVLNGRWRLVYTSSATFHRYGGLSSLEKAFSLRTALNAVSTPDLFMTMKLPYYVIFEETVKKQDPPELFGISLGDKAEASSIIIECQVEPSPKGFMTLTCGEFQEGNNRYAPTQFQEKAVRLVNIVSPTYIDDELLVLRASPATNLYIFVKA